MKGGLFSYQEAIKHVKLGKRVRSTMWDDCAYVYMDDQGFYRGEDDELFDFSVEFDEDEFVLWEEKQEKTGECGSTEDGERQSKQSIEENTTKQEDQQKSILKSETGKTGSGIKQTLSDSEKKSENITEKTRKNAMPGEHQTGTGRRPTESETGKLAEKHTESTGKDTVKKQESGTEKTTSLAVSTEIFTELKEEKSGSIQLLNSSAMQLITTGEMLIKNGKVKEGVKCLAEARNAMKTKLDYMKFGKDLIGGMK